MKINQNKIIALYIIWIFLHLIAFITSENFLSGYNSDFFPFPIYDTRSEKTLAYDYYETISKKYNIGEYEEYIVAVQDEQRLQRLYAGIKNELQFDSSVFINSINESIKKYGKEKYYEVIDTFFPAGFNQYDYSEFVIYLLLPLVLYTFIKLWYRD